MWRSNLFFTYLSSHSTRACQRLTTALKVERGEMKTKRELLLNTLSALNRMITLLFHLFLFSFLSSYGPLLLSCSASRLPGTTLSRALVPRSCVKKKKDCRGFLCHSFATIPLTYLMLTKIQHRVNSWEFPFYLFFNFLISLLASFSSVVVQEEIS